MDTVWDIDVKEEETVDLNLKDSNVEILDETNVMESKDEAINVKLETVDMEYSHQENSVGKDIKMEEEEFSDELHEHDNFLQNFKVKEENVNVLDFEDDDVCMKEEEVFYNPESGLNVEIDTLEPPKKERAKKQHAIHKRETMRTGGGSPPKPEDEETPKILSVIGDDLDGEENELDCDAVQNTGVIGIRNDGHECEITFDTHLMGQHTNNSVDSIETPLKLSEFNTAQSTPAGKVSSLKANTSRDTPTSIQFNTTDITSQCTPTPGQSNSTSARKRRRTAKFTQEASFEASLEMQQKEHQMIMESLRLDVEIKKEKPKKYKQEEEDANLRLQAIKIWVDVGKKLLEVTGELGQVTRKMCDKLDALN